MDEYRSLVSVEGETGRANAAFRDYAMMGPARSLRRLLARYQEEEAAGGVPPTTAWQTLSTWSGRHRWQERSGTFDMEVARAMQLEWHQRQVEEREREWHLAKRLVEQAERLLDECEGQDWRGVDAARLIDVAVKVARLAAEMDTDRPAVAVRVPIRYISPGGGSDYGEDDDDVGEG